jgi:hypothetical protein
MKKTLKWIGIGICVLVIFLMAGLTMFGGAMVKGAVNGFGPVLMGVPVTLKKASFSPLAGKIRLTNLHVGNPKGFNTPALFDLDEVDIELNARSLFSDVILIHRIAVVAPHITYEKALLDSNISELMKHLQGGKKTEAAKEQESGKKVIIEELIVTDPTLNVSITTAGGHSVPVKLGKIELKDVGKEHGGVTFSDAIAIVFGVITSNIENAVLGAGDLVGSGAKALGHGAETVGDSIAKGASSVIKDVGGFLNGDKKTDAKKSR